MSCDRIDSRYPVIGMKVLIYDILSIALKSILAYKLYSYR